MLSFAWGARNILTEEKTCKTRGENDSKLMEQNGGDRPRRCQQMLGAQHTWTSEHAVSLEGWPYIVCRSTWADLHSPNCEGLNDNRHAHGPHWLCLSCALSTVQRASHTSNGTVNYDFFILSAEDSVIFPSDSPRYRLIASNLRLYCFKIIFFIYLCQGVLCLHCSASCSLQREGATLWLCVWASHCCGSSWEHGHWGMQASVVAGCGLNTCSGQDLEHRLNN